MNTGKGKNMKHDKEAGEHCKNCINTAVHHKSYTELSYFELISA
jgi:hypothetical protein